MWDGSGALEALLSDLQRWEFLYAQTGVAEPTYVFKHSLAQEVAYESLLLTRRQTLHAAAGQALETLSAAWLVERYEALAHHFTLGHTWAKAFDYLAKSGDKARQAYATQEAIAFYTQALEVSHHVTPAVKEGQLLPVYEGRGLVWLLLNNIDEAITDFHTIKPYAMWKQDSKKPREPPRRNTLY
jgi:predicted ATPase